jgi:branched-chain amino acid transport system permease protein
MRYLPLAVVAVVIAAAPLIFPSSFYYKIGGTIFITAIAAIGLNVLMGFAGQVSLGHAGFFGLGAYAAALLPAKAGLHPLLAVAVGMLIAGVVAYVIGRPILRLKGHYLAVATLAAGMLMSTVLVNESAVTGGPDGMPVGRMAIGELKISGVVMWYWISAITMLLGAVLVVNLDASPTGRALRALHDSEIAAGVNGIDVAALKVKAFVISAVYASLAGSMMALSNGFITPDTASFLHSVELVTMVVLGGLGSVIGSIVGVALLKALPQLLTALHDYEQIVLGLIMILVMIFMRDGIVPTLAKLRLRTRSQPDQEGGA